MRFVSFLLAMFCADLTQGQVTQDPFCKPVTTTGNTQYLYHPPIPENAAACCDNVRVQFGMPGTYAFPGVTFRIASHCQKPDGTWEEWLYWEGTEFTVPQHHDPDDPYMLIAQIQIRGCERKCEFRLEVRNAVGGWDGANTALEVTCGGIECNTQLIAGPLALAREIASGFSPTI